MLDQPDHLSVPPLSHAVQHESVEGGAVFVMTNDSAGNEVLAFSRDAGGRLKLSGVHPTGGAGSGHPHLSSQGSVVLTADGRFLLVVNPGSSSLSVFAVDEAHLELLSAVPTRGRALVGATVLNDLVYVVHKGDDDEVGGLCGFRLGDDGALVPIEDSRRPLSAPGSNPAQVGITPDGRTLVVTEESSNMIGTWPIDAEGRPGTGSFSDSARATPFGFAFTRTGTLIVANAERGNTGQASVSSYQVSDSSAEVISAAVADLRSEACWTVLSRDETFVYITNYGDGTVSSYRLSPDGMLMLLESVAAITAPGKCSVRDAGITLEGDFLYAIDVATATVHSWAVGASGLLTPVGATGGLPATAAGLAAR